MILIIGATGNLGGEICRRLTAEGKDVRAMVRKSADQAKTANLKQMGVQLVTGDLREYGTFEPALHDVDTVITTVSSMPFSYVPGDNDIEQVDLKGMKKLIDKAKAAGVKQFIYTSFSKQIDVDVPLNQAKRAVERHLQQSGMAYTILRPSYFMEVWLTPAVGFDVGNAKAQIYGEGTKPISYISYQDVAQFAVESIGNLAAKNVELELGGPEMLSQLDAVKVFEEMDGREFEIQHVPAGVLREQMIGATDPMQKSFSGLMLGAALGDPIEMKELLKTFPIKLTTVKDFAQKMAAIV